MLIVTGALILLTVMIAATKPQSGKALPGDLSSAVSKYPNLAVSSLNTCDLCHTVSIPNLNPYGAAYKSNGRNMAAFGLIENLDSDGDGVSNIQELSSLTFPGNPASFPALPTATNTAVPLPTNTGIPVSTNTPVPTGVIPPSATSIIPPGSASVTTGLTPPSVTVGGSSTATVSLNNVPAGGLASAEFTCTFNPAILEVSNITQTSLFGADPVAVVNGPQNGSFIVAIAGSNGNKAIAGGAAFSFSVKGLQVGQSAIDCQSRVSTGNLVLESIPSTPANLVTTSAQGTLAGQVLALKPVTVTLYNSASSIAGFVTANGDGTFNLSAPGGPYTAVASAPGYIKAQASISLTNGNTTTLQPISLLAGDIDGNDVIDQYDALTIGINYNGSAPAAADLNNDGTINVLDLEILARNYRQAGSLAWQ
jgi:hypothetical protein